MSTYFTDNFNAAIFKMFFLFVSAVITSQISAHAQHSLSPFSGFPHIGHSSPYVIIPTPLLYGP